MVPRCPTLGQKSSRFVAPNGAMRLAEHQAACQQLPCEDVLRGRMVIDQSNILHWGEIDSCNVTTALEGEEMARPHHEELEQHCRINKQHQKDLVTLGHR